MKKKKKILPIMLVVLLIFGAVFLYVYREYNRAHKDTTELRADFSLNATDLLKEFETGETAANKKYWDKVIRVNGPVKSLSKDERGVYSVELGDRASMSAVRCSMDSAHNAEAMSLVNGHEVALKGICTGYNADELLGADIILVRCVVDKKK